MDSLSKAMENYLKTIYELSYTNQGVRLTDLASKMEVKKASANNAVMKLIEMGYCLQIKYGKIFLTDKGIEAIKTAAGRNIIIVKFLRDILEIDSNTAEKEASEIEYYLSTSTVYAMHQLYKKMKS